MTMEEAIEILQSGAGIWPITDRANNALNKAIKALEQAPCEDAISRQAVLDAIEDDNRNGHYSCFASNYDAQCFKGVIGELPSVNPQEPQSGYWQKHTDASGNSWHACPACGHIAYTLTRFCPDCGTRLEAPS